MLWKIPLRLLNSRFGHSESAAGMVGSFLALKSEKKLAVAVLENVRHVLELLQWWNDAPTDEASQSGGARGEPTGYRG